MRIQILVLALFLTTVSYAQETKEFKNAKKFQQKLNKEFSSKEESPLKEEDLANFESLDFFPIDSSFIVNATLTLHKNSEPFAMKTTTDRLPIYKVYATASFEIQGKPFSLEIYQNEKLVLTTEYEDYLFLPFTDKTNGDSSYGGGRYLDLKLPEGNSIIIDFNQAYNPYCAYNDKYSCPVPPKNNNLDIEVLAGVKSFKP